MNTHDQDNFLNQIREVLNQSVAHIDTDTQKQLDDIRSQALTQKRVTEPVNDSEESLVTAAQAGLDDSIADLDPAVLARLNEARKSALAQNELPTSAPGIWQQLTAGFNLPQITVPVGAFATACVLVTVATLFYQFPDQSAGELAEADILLFASSDEIELYDNLEFYLWLADNGLPN